MRARRRRGGLRGDGSGRDHRVIGLYMHAPDAGHECVDTPGPWSDFIKEFGFVLPKQSKCIQSMTKMQMRAHESQSAPFGGAL